MKKILGRCFTVLAVTALILAGLAGLSRITERKESTQKFVDFYENTQEFDVLFFGQSHVLNGIFPMELWKEHGLVSYNMGGHGNRLPLTYWVIKNTLEYAKPKLIVVDCYMLGLDDKLETLEQLHISSDHFPLTKTKIEMIRDMVEDEERQGDFLWEFSTYHHRWNDLKEEDFQVPNAIEKGAESRSNVAMTEENLLWETEILEEVTLGTEYLYKILELAEEEGIEVLLTYLPFPDNTGWQIESNTAKMIAEEENVLFLDYHTLWNQVDPATDFYDPNSHMNPSGATKITRYIGDFIMENYDMTDHREDPAYADWEEDYQEYSRFKTENLIKEEDLETYLMLLKNCDVDYALYVKPNSSVWQEPVLTKLLMDLGVNIAGFTEGDRILYVEKDMENGKKKETWINLFERTETKAGDLSLFYNDDGHLVIETPDTEQMEVTFSEIGLVIFDRETSGILDKKKITMGEIDPSWTLQQE